mmetsp:Transcript_931/g.2003  ORF Transcript_931/g.2003 Transcript_931/m.2003 type:complete len:395 (+) Transcript_931:38-1222(+)
MALKPSVLKFKIDDFESLPSEPGKNVPSDRITDDDGNAWRLTLKPGGTKDTVIGGGESDADPFVALFLKNVGQKNLHVKFEMILRDARGAAYCERCIKPTLLEVGKTYGIPKFIKRSMILNKENNILVDGALLVDVLMQILPDAVSLYVPTNPLGANILKLLENDEKADVWFNVENTIVHAHKFILDLNAPLLFDFCKGHNEEEDGNKNSNTEPIPIDDIKLGIFRIILRYVYGGDVPPDSINNDTGSDLIMAANRLDVPGLKLAVEMTLVKSLTLTRASVADWLMFADARDCPLLKEYVTSYIVARATDFMFMNSEWTKKLSESPWLMHELMLEISMRLNNDSRFDSTGRNMSVSELRTKLHEKGLDVDGSKTTLISRLQGSNKRQKTDRNSI